MSVGKFIGVLMSSREQAHVFHLTTSSFAAHKALQAYYEAIVPLLDSYAETYMGKSKRKITGLTPYVNRKIYTNSKLARGYFTKLAKTIQKIKLPKDPYLDNIRQEIDALVRQTMYMLSLR